MHRLLSCLFFLMIVVCGTGGNVYSGDDGVVRKSLPPDRFNYLTLLDQLDSIKEMTPTDRDGVARRIVIDYLDHQIERIDDQFVRLLQIENIKLFMETFDVESLDQAYTIIKELRDQLIENNLNPDKEYLGEAKYESIVTYIDKFKHYDMWTQIDERFYGQKDQPRFINTLVGKFQGKLLEVETIANDLEERILSSKALDSGTTKDIPRLFLWRIFKSSKIIGLLALANVLVYLDGIEKNGVRIPLKEIKGYLQAVQENPSNVYKHPLLRGKHLSIKVLGLLRNVLGVPLWIIGYIIYSASGCHT